MTILDTTTNTDLTIQGGLVNQWPFGAELISMESMVARLGLPTTMPRSSDIEEFLLPEELLCPRIGVRLEFECSKVRFPDSRLGNASHPTPMYIARQYIHSHMLRPGNGWNNHR